MQFTPREMKLIERLRKLERTWCWRRWVLLALGMLVVGVYAYIGVSLYHRLHWEALTPEDAYLVAIYWPKILLGMCFAVWCFVWPLANWRGDATRVLLLKLLDAQSPRTGNDGTGSSQ